MQGVLVLILGYVFAGDLETISSLADDIVLVVGVITTWYGRFRLGDISVVGKRK